MSATQASLGYGSKFFTGVTGSPITYNAVLEIASITMTDYTVSEVDATHLQSPNATEETIPGLIKTGTIELTGNYLGDTTQQELDTLGQARTVFPWKITAPAAGTTVLTATGSGFINKMEKGPFESNKKSDIKVSIKITGPIAYAIA
jgi:hypothetical protein